MISFGCRGDTEVVVDKRMKIYFTLLLQMVPEHLLATSAKLCAEILAAAADGLLDLNDGPSQCVLKVHPCFFVSLVSQVFM